MPPETERLRYTRGALQALRRALEGKSREELVELVCNLQKTYVFDQTLPYDVPLPERVEQPDPPDVAEGPDRDAPEADPNDTPQRRFARLIEGLKKKTGLPQLEGFTTDPEGRAMLVVDNQKVTFGDRVTIEFTRGRSATGAVSTQAPPPPDPPRATPERAERPRPAPPPPAARRDPPKPAPKPAPPPPPTDEDGSSGRIGRLELD